MIGRSLAAMVLLISLGQQALADEARATLSVGATVIDPCLVDTSSQPAPTIGCHMAPAYQVDSTRELSLIPGLSDAIAPAALAAREFDGATVFLTITF